MRNDYLSTQTKQELVEKNISKVYEGAISTSFDLYQITGDTSYLYQAFTASERSKAYLLREALSGSKAKQFAGIYDSLLQDEKELKIKIAFYEKNLFEIEHPAVGKEIDTVKVHSYQNNLFDLKREDENLVTTLEKDYPEYYQIKYETKVVSVKETRENMLDDHSAFVEYFMGDSTIYAFLITKNNIALQSIKSFDKAQKVVQELKTTFPLFASKFDLTRYQKLTQNSFLSYQNLLAPVLYSLETDPKKLIIASDGAVSYLPFELLLYKEATNYSIIHLATHAEVEDSNPLYSRIYFTNTNDSIEDDTLHTYELYNMKLNADLVVLSGCATGSGEYVKGEGVMSLSRGVYVCRYRHVVLSLWQVSDVHTSELMGYFYKFLSEGFVKRSSITKSRCFCISSLLLIIVHIAWR